MKLLFALMLLPALMPEDNIPAADSLHIEEIIVMSSLKTGTSLSEQPAAATTLTLSTIENNRITEPKYLSFNVPNLIYADYGSKMTSSVYIRGIGSRMDQPAMGLYIDNIPILNKNNYDVDYFDVQQIDVLRGPQGTLYGRNTIGGVIDVHTLSPLSYNGTRLSAGYGNGNTFEARAATYYHSPDYRRGVSIALSHRYSDGFFTNQFDGSDADRISSSGARIKFQAILSDRWNITNSLYLNRVKQRGFPYALIDDQTGRTLSIDHNDPCTYDRFGIIEGITFGYSGRTFSFSSTTSYQYTDDDMHLDQDFRPVSMFTLRQKQIEHAATQEFIFKSQSRSHWQWISGLFGFYRHIDMQAPVTFKRDGIDELILANANSGIHTVFPDADILIEEDQFVIESNFKLPAYGASLYHQSSYEVGRWRFTAGIRADVEHTAIRFDNQTRLHYRFNMTMPDYVPLPVTMEGRDSKTFFEFMPRLAVMYNIGESNIYINVSRGYKSGGFNTQIFSDILQNRMMNAMMSELGVYFDGYEPGYDAASAISYDPEQSWNYELGAHLSLSGGKLALEPVVFYIDCRNQQLTVFPPGKSTGRLMSNAGRTRSYGAELTARYSYRKLRLSASYGHTNATFVTFDNGNEDFSGNHVPYAPLHTVALNGEYSFTVGGKVIDRIVLSAGWNGAGKIYWNEENTVTQPFYGMLNGSVKLRRDKLSLTFWGRNLTDTKYNTFYFKSVGNAFVQKGRPVTFGATLNLNL